MKYSIIPIVCLLLSTAVFAQEKQNEAVPAYKYSLSTSYFSFINFGPTSVSMYELRAGYQFTPKDRIELKLCTWRLFEPMGIPLWEPLLQNPSEWYPARSGKAASASLTSG